MMRWNAQLAARLMALVAEGKKWDEIGLQLGCAASAAHAHWRKIRRLEIDDGAPKLRSGGKRSGTVSASNQAEIQALRAEGLTRREISARTGWSGRTLDRYMPVNPTLRNDPAKHRDAYDAAYAKGPNERKHLQALYDANGYGFGWWPPSLMARVYLIEASAQVGRDFWRAA